MTPETERQTERDPAVAPRARWIKPLLIASLALNLAVLGLVGGAILSGGPPIRDGMDRDSLRDAGLGILAEGLSRADRGALRRALLEADPGLVDWRARAGQDVAVLLAALRAEPFDPAALQAALDEQSGRMQARITAGRRALVDRIAQMPPAERAAFADRLEERLDHMPGMRRRD